MKIKLDAGAYKPTRAYSTDAGLDIYAMKPGTVNGGSTYTFRTGVHVQLPPGTVGVLQPKSGLMTRLDILTFGVIDSGYSGEIIVHVFNFGKYPYIVHAGEKISQLLVLPIVVEEVEIVSAIESGERGENGFGSSGK